MKSIEKRRKIQILIIQKQEEITYDFKNSNFPIYKSSSKGWHYVYFAYV